MSRQVNLHAHSSGSFLDGLSSTRNNVKRAVELGQQYVAITDHGECNQHIELSRQCEKAGVGAVYGIEGYWLTEDRINTARADKVYPNPSHMCLLAATQEGLTNLWSLSSDAYTGEDFYYKPIVTPETMRKYAEGVYCSDGCMITDFADAVEAGHDDLARQLLGVLIDIYRDRFYMELHTWQFMEPKTDEQRDLNARMTRLNQAKVQLAQELSVPLVVVNDSHHADPSEWISREMLWTMNTSSDADRMLLQARTEERMAQKADHLMGDEELVHWMGVHGISSDVVIEAIRNSYDIAASCTARIQPTLNPPRLYADDREDLKRLIQACEVGMQRRVLDRGLEEAPYLQRLEEELSLISDKKFAGYFNVVRSCVGDFRSGAWARWVGTGEEKPILVGPGRGSAGGSLVAFLTGIHLVDPLRYGTLFSRFLSPGRKLPPDIDVDIPQSYRPDALEYFRARFGQDNVCAIGTVNRSGVKQVLKDLGRAQDIPFTELQKISDLLDEDWEDSEDLKPWRGRYPDLFAHLSSLTGIARHSGVHASGVLIASDPIHGRVPLRRTKNKVFTTQFEMDEVELLGGVKFDWLGLRHLDTLMVARDLVLRHHGIWLDYDGSGDHPTARLTVHPDEDLLTDPAIWEQVDRGRIAGIFQLDTPTSTRVAREYRARSPIDVANLTSIVRPGVSDAGLTQEFLNRRHGISEVTYDHPLMRKFVGPEWVTDTYGILVYQEQIIQCVQDMAGFTPDEADDLRKAVGKKIMDKLQAMKGKFIDGCLDNPEFTGVYDSAREKVDRRAAATRTAEKIWTSIEAAGRYAFNWSHAVEYGAFLSSWEVWTKHFFPKEFLVSCMRTDPDGVARYIAECRARGIEVLGPDINASDVRFAIEGDAVRFGLEDVKGVGEAAVKEIIAGRPYRSFESYLRKSGKGGNKAIVYSLALIGAFDSLEGRVSVLRQLGRHRAMSGLSVRTLLDPKKRGKIVEDRLSKNQYAVDIPDFDDEVTLYHIETQLVGTYLTRDPMEKYDAAIREKAVSTLDAERDITKGMVYFVGGELKEIRPTVTKRGQNPGQEMAQLKVRNGDEEFGVVAFPEAWRRCKSLLNQGSPVLLKVKKLESGGSLVSVERLDVRSET